MRGVGGLNKAANGVVVDLVQIRLPLRAHKGPEPHPPVPQVPGTVVDIPEPPGPSHRKALAP